MFTRILIVEDQRDALAEMADLCLQAFPAAFVDQSSDCARALSLIARKRPQLALIDLDLPDGSGIGLLGALRQSEPLIIPVVMTALHNEECIFSALRAGAQGYLLKDEVPEVLISALRGLAADIPPVSPSVTRALLRHFADQAGDVVAPARGTAALTARQQEVLSGIAEGLTVRALAARMQISVNTVATHIKHIYAKLDVRERAGATRAAAQLGLLK